MNMSSEYSQRAGRLGVAFTLTADNEDQLCELAALLGAEPEAVVNLVAILGFGKELRVQLEGARRKALQQGSPYRPIDWNAAYRPAPAPARIDFAGALAVREGRR